jgi:hypothetical protein
MATVLENLQARQAAASAELAALTARPDYSIDGESVQWGGLRAALVKEITDLQKMIVEMEGPAEVHVQGYAG